MVPLPSECRESKVRYPAPWGGKGGKASWVQGLPWGIDTFHYLALDVKAPWDRYQQICGSAADSTKVIETLALLADASVDWEVRTTVYPSLSQGDMSAIGAQIPSGVHWRWNEYRVPEVYRQEDSQIIHAPAWKRSGGWG